MNESPEKPLLPHSDPPPPLFTGGAMSKQEPRSWKPLLIAGVVVLAIVGVLLVLGHRSQTAATQANTLAPAAAYAASLPITGIQMSDSTGISGDKQTYLDGTVTNRGSKTVTGVTVQVAFKSYDGTVAAVDTLPLTLIRFRQPYVDTVPVSMAPIAPGQSHSFRLIFDSVPDSWGGAYPEVRVTSVDVR
jgi:hypothetical protein